MKKISFLFLFFFCFQIANAQYSRIDSLLGSIGPERAWWDLKYYDLNMTVDVENKLFKGHNTIFFEAVSAGQTMQIDLQPPMKITSIKQGEQLLNWEKDGPNAYMVTLISNLSKGEKEKIQVFFEGQPTVAANAPWDGGITWSTDLEGNPFVATANQGIGASVWWPCKDHPADEVDSVQLSVRVPDGLWNISNGRMRDMTLHEDGSRSTTWFVSNPINSYGININIGNYVSWTDVYQGEKGPLDLSFYVLPENLAKAKNQFKDVYRTLEAIEHWYGPYPFYEDGYKLVEVPYLGMEHQSSITYGNGFKNGYKGRDLSDTGWGLKWDFIIIHESTHEWFANNITNKDVADMWIHESFTNYAENLFTEYFYGKEAGAAYVIGTRKLIENKRNIIGDYGVHQSSGIDIYYKGGNMLHTLRQWVGNDEKWRTMLRGLGEEFYHQTVTTSQVENYIALKLDLDLVAFFNQYLRSTNIPTLEYRISEEGISFRYSNIVTGFKMPIRVIIDDKNLEITPSSEWQKVLGQTLEVDVNYYILEKELK